MFLHQSMAQFLYMGPKIAERFSKHLLSIYYVQGPKDANTKNYMVTTDFLKYIIYISVMFFLSSGPSSFCPSSLKDDVKKKAKIKNSEPTMVMSKKPPNPAILTPSPFLRCHGCGGGCRKKKFEKHRRRRNYWRKKGQHH